MDERIPVPHIVLKGLGEDYHKKPGGGSKEPKNFNEVTTERREFLKSQVSNVKKSFANLFFKYPEVPCVARVMLHNDALAKTHRPIQVFKKETCPIIGSGDFNELYVEVWENRLDRLSEIIGSAQGKKAIANISAIDDILPFTSKDAIPERSIVLDEIKNGRPIKMQLFNLSSASTNTKVRGVFQQHVEAVGAELISLIDYAPGTTFVKVKCESVKQFNDIMAFGTVRKVSYFPLYRMVPTRVDNLPGLSDFPKPTPGVDYPIVGLIDTGIIENHRLLEPWIYQRVSYIPNEYKNHKHATFIGGILASGDTFNRYNHHSTGLEGVKILDVCTIPNDDPNQASVDFLSEDDLITRLRDVVPQFKNQVKFWNLSLGSDTTCSLDSFSDLAIAVDSIQAENSVMFVIASGNDVNLPVREWPPQPIIRDRDILCPPADSLRGMTTGSIAGIDNQHTVVKRNHPSPFSRRGFGPNFVVKPDLVTYGGNCNDRIQPCNSGVISIDEAGNLVEGIGTSYAAPYATALIASIYKAYGGQISLNLCKALVLHSCYHPETLGVPDRNDMPYYGFGLPGHFSTILTGTRSNATIIYEHQLAEGMDIQIPDFPFPNCLVRNEKCYGEILMTLVYDPPLDANYGLEYCRVNIDAALGRYSQKIDKDTGEIKEVFNAEIPHLPQIKARETKDLFERRLIEYGFKWSPVKRYYKKLNGIENKRWGLQVRMHVRSEETGVLAQSFALVISFRDPTGGDVYGDLRKTINRPSMELSIEERIKAALGV